MEYVLGGAVLGRSIDEIGTRYEKLCLCTADVQEWPHRALLREAGWHLKQVNHVRAVPRLFLGDMERSRFRHVFTKLRAMAEVQYEKVLLLDIDTLVLQPMDGLFDLPAPAAMRRGMNSRNWSEHGRAMDGWSLFRGRGE